MLGMVVLFAMADEVGGHHLLASAEGAPEELLPSLRQDELRAGHSREC